MRISVYPSYTDIHRDMWIFWEQDTDIQYTVFFETVVMGIEKHIIFSDVIQNNMYLPYNIDDLEWWQ